MSTRGHFKDATNRIVHVIIAVVIVVTTDHNKLAAKIGLLPPRPLRQLLDDAVLKT